METACIELKKVKECDIIISMHTTNDDMMWKKVKELRLIKRELPIFPVILEQTPSGKIFDSDLNVFLFSLLFFYY
jgi:hypothetical protein